MYGILKRILGSKLLNQLDVPFNLTSKHRIDYSSGKQQETFKNFLILFTKRDELSPELIWNEDTF
jgi:hypothetical protein